MSCCVCNVITIIIEIIPSPRSLLSLLVSLLISSPFLPLPFSTLPSPPLPLEVGPLNPARGEGERGRLPQQV